MSATKPDWLSNWSRHKQWRGGEGLPILPPLAAMAELAALVAAIMVIDWSFPSLGFSTAEPSPFWVPVLLLSLQYGTIAGLLAAAAATAAYVVNGVADQAVGENFFVYLLRIWALPILWIGVALVLGQFRLRQIAAKQAIRQRLAKRSSEADRLALYAKDLESRCHRLERQLTTRNTAPVQPILDALTAIANAESNLDHALDLLTARIWPGAQVSIFAGSANGCELISKSGWPATAAWASEIQSNHPLYRAITEQRRAVCILNPGDENVLAGLGVAAHPIFSPDRQRVVAMLKIEAIDAPLLSQSIGTHMALIADLFAKAIAPHLVDAPPAANRKIAPLPGVAWLRRNWRSVNGGSVPSGLSDDQPPVSARDALPPRRPS